MTDNKEVTEIPGLRDFQTAVNASMRYMVIHAVSELGLPVTEVLHTLNEALDQILLIALEAAAEEMEELANGGNSTSTEN